MKITRTHIFHYRLPLDQPIRVHGHELQMREGLIIQILNETDVSGFGEVAPLPGLSQENFTNAQQQTLMIKTKLKNVPVPQSIEQLNGTFESWLGQYHLYPSVRFGIEMAALNLLANSREINLCQLLSTTYQDKILVNGLLQGPKSVVLSQAKELLNQHFKSIKIKVEGKDVQQDIDKVRSVVKLIDAQALLRVDANQCWDLATATLFGKGIGCAAIEYIEEPFADIDKISQFYDETLIPVAVDETLSNSDFNRIKSIDGIEIFILKPTILGGIEKTWQLAQQAKKFGIEVVISSSFESGIGLTTLAHLAACLCKNTAVGLDTRKYFKKDLLLNNKLPISDGKIDITKTHFDMNDINKKLWTEIKK